MDHEFGVGAGLLQLVGLAVQGEAAAMADAPDMAAHQSAIDIVLLEIGREVVEAQLDIGLAAMSVWHQQRNDAPAEIGDARFQAAGALERIKEGRLALV